MSHTSLPREMEAETLGRHRVVSAALAALLPPEAACAVVAIGIAPETPYTEERAAIAGTAPGRRAEFNAGRAAARQALARLGLDAVSIPSGPHRLPLWPAGVTGSIAHAAGLAAAIVALAPKDCGRALGLDLEANYRVGADVARAIAATEEILPRAAARAFRVANVCADTLRFTVKEAAFKASFPASGRFLPFHAAAADLSPCGAFTVRLLRSAAVPSAVGQPAIPGRWTAAANVLLAVAEVGDWDLGAAAPD